MQPKGETPKSVEQRLRDGESVETAEVIDELWRMKAGWDNQREYAESLRCQMLDEAPTVHQIAADIFVRWMAHFGARQAPRDAALDAYEAAAALRAVRAERVAIDHEARMRELFGDESSDEPAP